ncbi:MAG: pccB, partial [Frankiales bacterium]|nr:pccB [Frankiales bacterium]
MTLAPVSTASLATSRLYRLLETSQPHVEAAGVVVMTGSVSGTPVVAFATDSSVQGGALGIDGCRAIADATDLAVDQGVPIIGIWHSGGARLR